MNRLLFILLDFWKYFKNGSIVRWVEVELSWVELRLSLAIRSIQSKSRNFFKTISQNQNINIFRDCFLPPSPFSLFRSGEGQICSPPNRKLFKILSYIEIHCLFKYVYYSIFIKIKMTTPSSKLRQTDRPRYFYMYSVFQKNIVFCFSNFSASKTSWKVVLYFF